MVSRAPQTFWPFCGASDVHAPQKAYILWRIQSNAPQNVLFLWRIPTHAPQKYRGSHVPIIGPGPSGDILWRTCPSAPQKVHILWRTGHHAPQNVSFLWRTGLRAPQKVDILWRTELRAPQNVGPDPQKGGTTHFPHVTFFILPPCI